MTRCRDFALYDLEAVKNKRGAVMPHWDGRCLWHLKGIPISMMLRLQSQPVKMKPNREHNCPTFVPRKDAK